MVDVTAQRIKALQHQAVAAGDRRLAILCERALHGSPSAWQVCESALAVSAAG